VFIIRAISNVVLMKHLSHSEQLSISAVCAPSCNGIQRASFLYIVYSYQLFSSCLLIHHSYLLYCSLSFSATLNITLRSFLPSLQIMLLLNLVCSTSFPYHSFSPHLGHPFVVFRQRHLSSYSPYFYRGIIVKNRNFFLQNKNR